MKTAVLVCLCLASASSARGLTPEEIKAALNEKRAVTYEVRTEANVNGIGPGGDSVALVSTPYSRLTWIAQEARERSEELSEVAIAEAIKDTSICVSTPASESVLVAMVLIPRKTRPTPASVIKPAEASAFIHDMYNKLGGRWKEASFTGCIPGDTPTAELDVVVLYQGGHPIRAPFPKELR